MHCSATATVFAIASRELVEQPRHARRRLEIVLVVRAQQRAGVLQRRSVLDARHHVGEARVVARRVRDAVRRDVRDVEPPREPHHRADQRRVFRPHVVLQLEVEAAGEQVAQTRADRERAVVVAAQQRLLDQAVAAAGERDQAAGAAVEVIQPQARVALAPAQLRRRDRAREVAVAGLVGRDQDEPRRAGRDLLGRPRRAARPDRCGVRGLERELRAAERGEAGDRRGGFREAHRAVDAVPVGERDPAKPEPAAALDQLLGVRAAFEEAEVRPAVELGILGRGHGRDEDTRTHVRSPARSGHLRGEDTKSGRLTTKSLPIDPTYAMLTLWTPDSRCSEATPAPASSSRRSHYERHTRERLRA